MGNPAEDMVEAVTAAKPRTEHIVFHARPSKNLKDPSYTIRFENKDGMLLCTYSRPHPGLESYCKSSGRFYVGQRMSALKEELKDAVLQSPDMANIKLCKRILPSRVKKTIGYYANCARKYFKLAENPIVIVRGQYADWQDWMNKGRATRVPLKSVIVSARLNDLNSKP